MNTNDIIKAEKANPQTRSPQEIEKRSKLKRDVKKLGKNIEARRSKMNLSREDLARRSNVDIEKIESLERGKILLDVFSIYEIANKLTTTVEKLLTLDFTKNEDERNSENAEKDKIERRRRREEDAKELGKKIHKKREEAGITRAQLAEGAGVSEVAISRYEAGKRMPQFNTVQKIAEYLGTTVNEFRKEKTEEIL